jgi:hypothetical protein
MVTAAIEMADVTIIPVHDLPSDVVVVRVGRNDLPRCR